jgi:UDP-N-acetyl-D-mannosaminuronic acid dehydrogenase
MISIIGLGEIGGEILKELCKKRNDIVGVDINKKVIEELAQQGYKVTKNIPLSDMYIIAVYATAHVFDVIKKINFSNNPLIVIESTIQPGTYKKILLWKKKNKKKFDLVLFPHRFNPQDPAHHVFNLARVIGGENNAVKRALEFYQQFMPLSLIHQTTGEIAELTKPMENAYRYLEIALAEELKMLCDKKKIDFAELRNAMNTKWNINVKEAREGIGGKCLPKDLALVNNFFKNNVMFAKSKEIDEKFKRYVKKRKKK